MRTFLLVSNRVRWLIELNLVMIKFILNQWFVLKFIVIYYYFIFSTALTEYLMTYFIMYKGV